MSSKGNQSDKGRPNGTRLVLGVVRGLRIRRGWTQSDLAEVSGLTSRTIVAAEAGKPLSIRTIRDLATALGVSLSLLSDAFDDACTDASPDTRPTTYQKRA